MSFLIRVLLPDTPGALGQLADAIGQTGGNIQSVDIIEAFSADAVMDDIVVDLPQGVMADALITAANSVDGVEVDSIRPFSGRVDRRGQIEMLSHLATNRGGLRTSLQDFVSAFPKALTSSWAIIVDTTDRITRVAASSAAPEDDGSIPADIDVTSARVLVADSEDWIPDSWRILDSALAGAPLGDSGLVLIIGRAGGPDYLASEVVHLGHLGNILGKLID
ncbi:amino acid-binding ACT domain protein [Corynebacterium pseudodiphtheriticum]|uniref:amino acid-binding ACT domain protein n=1 Tax=Corynebacterium pseudodiphtheriticum TaxID=37637 RepID=UPI00234C48EA|nr:amino acid-binding ACT domain protein [Corynebacterium pseudodiphtheriticum]MDC7067368.1 amino acid-binding ACT domain protein [Corynebacterium pseudodiphtheriticum]MDC7083434.1 amino acid-binding ACT domain protein [Corynebacterium pseudodiphtheriticum]MDC7085590.1 amino acid-binding ACT domain protein [Corynebacterium pseudodiphtheriticum]MDK4285623.1 amino acid-binding ACT domain protein [Corynebacterium pseudodiphtheriticum]MDK4314839.1 amino acid-binding ACT domain protein [Corynebacte